MKNLKIWSPRQNNMQSILKITLGVALVGALVGSGTTLIAKRFMKPSAQDLIQEFYAVENAVHVSPHSLRRNMDKGENNFTLVDLRSAQEYEKEHITGAINIPAYKDPDTSAYEEVDRIVASFAALPKNKDIIVYCYSMACMTGRKIGKMLTEHHIYVKHLGIGWNEWRHFWTLWNHEHEWKTTKAEEYITQGKEPGTPKLRELPSPCGEGTFSC